MTACLLLVALLATAASRAPPPGTRRVNTSLATIVSKVCTARAHTRRLTLCCTVYMLQPVGYFGGLSDARTSANLEGLSKMRLVVIEKWEGPCWFECLANGTAAQPPRPCDPGCGEEDYQLATIKRIKARNPGVATVFYLNTLYNFPYYKLAGAFAAARENVLGADGKPINLINDDGMKHIEIMDFGQPSAIKRYLDFHRGLVASGLVDGTFPDKTGIRASKNATSDQWQLCEMNGGAAFGHSWSDACGEISEATALACALILPCLPAMLRPALAWLCSWV
eukprot:SAG11_NODE_7986_length_1073_cov_1.282341_2_plen_281_part_00